MPITLPFTQTRTASGTTAPAAASASVRAVQSVGDVPKVEVASTNAATVTGAYSGTLATAPPQFAPYSTMQPLVFMPQVANAAKYVLEASAVGYVTQSAAVDLTSTDATVDFTMPLAP